MEIPESYRRIRRDMTTPVPQGLESLATAFVSLRQALGYRTTGLRRDLRTLVGFMCAHGLSSFEQVEGPLASEWLHTGAPQEMTVVVRLASVRGFYRYLQGLEVVQKNVWDAFPTPVPKRFVPYVFTLAELRLILGFVRRMMVSRSPGLTWLFASYYGMYHTLYACGLRAREICRLKLGDVNFQESLLVIRNTKFGKTRLVPFNARTREILEEHLRQHRPGSVGLHPEAPLFVNMWRRPFQPKALSGHFWRVCTAVGIYRRERVEGNLVFGSPSLHSLRHSFAVHRMLKWYEEGADINAKLPLLATYMGHVHYHNTQKYLRVLPVFIDVASRKFATRSEGELKDLECPSDT